MKQNRVSFLLERYLVAQEAGKEVYFDADEIDDILEWLESTNEYTYYEDILSLGLRLHPNSTELRIRLCKLYIYNEEFKKTLDLIDSIAEPDNIDLELLRLECYCSLDQYPKVVSYIENLIRENSENLEEIFEYLAPIISDLEMEEETRDFIERGLRLFPDSTILKDELCIYLESIGNISGAIEVCNELIDKNPYSVDYWFMLGKLYSMSANYEKAIEAFDFALTCDDSDVELKVLKAYCLFMNDNYEKALEVYLDVIEEDRDLTDRVNPLLVECYIKLERFKEGYEILKLQIQDRDINKDDDIACFINFIRCCMEIGKKTEATEALNKALELYPNNIRLLSILAVKYKEEGNNEKSKEITDIVFRQIDNSEGGIIENAENLLQTAQFLNQKNEIEEALKYYLKILEIDPEMPMLNMYIAMAYLSLGNTAKFSEYYKKTSPNDLIEFADLSDSILNSLRQNSENEHIQPENLTKEFLKNKGLRN